MSFFIRNKQGSGGNKRKFNGHVKTTKRKRKNVSKSVPEDNESIASTDEELAEENQRDEEYESEEEEETAQEKRVRLAKKYLEQIEEEERDKIEFQEGAVTRRLHEEYLEEKGRLRKTVASNYVNYAEPIVLKCKEHKNSITCLSLSSDGKVLYSGSKDGSLVKWSLKERTKLKAIKGKSKSQDGIKCVQCLAVSTDGIPILYYLKKLLAISKFQML
ncbi:PREDICTED: U3 small nucleolar RNA-interacting protein 2-like [Eufriesea mexicana]|uniref:U3 small nucleolar RNA-interacting protein 2-like n=1 Tax=Eufriesea mexicana TaxID=516756 RepID=UPI00083BCFD2|nr:PREDICTED: U3 small nucleolar RNA-interacting protein 2-like [Eufriesea mexicana]